MYTPYDLNEAIQQKREFCENRLREGSPVAGLAYDGGLMLLTVRRTQRKVYQVYDRQVFAAIGNQSDIEQLRLAAIGVAHREGFDRSPDDVTIHRLVGFELSPAVKKAYREQFSTPFVVRALFGELGRTPTGDGFTVLDYDGEFVQYPVAGAIGGTAAAADAMLERLGTSPAESVDAAAAKCMSAWVAGNRAALARDSEPGADGPDPSARGSVSDGAALRDELKTGSVEACILERRAGEGSRFRLLTADECKRAVQSVGN